MSADMAAVNRSLAEIAAHRYDADGRQLPRGADGLTLEQVVQGWRDEEARILARYGGDADAANRAMGLENWAEKTRHPVGLTDAEIRCKRAEIKAVCGFAGLLNCELVDGDWKERMTATEAAAYLRERMGDRAPSLATIREYCKPYYRRRFAKRLRALRWPVPIRRGRGAWVLTRRALDEYIRRNSR